MRATHFYRQLADKWVGVCDGVGVSQLGETAQSEDELS